MLAALLVLVAARPSAPLPPPPSCGHLRQPFGARGVPGHLVPDRPVSGPMVLCSSPSSCCSPGSERALASWGEARYRASLANTTAALLAELDARAEQVDSFIYALLDKAQRDFHEMFTRTYGVMYQKNAAVFQEYFEDLRAYYHKGSLNPATSTAAFFTTLYQKMFQVLNTQYTFDGLYLSCVAENIDHLRPFGDVPRKMATSVKRSLVAARALVKALRTGHDITLQMAKVEPSPACLAAVGRMAACPACQGLPATRPCPGLCLNTMKGCLAHHYGVDDLWAKFTDSLASLAERLVGPFNVEMTVEPISIKISDAIMNFQESGFQVTQKVFELCGTPRLGRRQAAHDSSPFVFEKRLEKSHRPSARPSKSDFEKMLIELKRRVREFSGVWAEAPHAMCEAGQQQAGAGQEALCWNGEDAASYQGKVVEDGLASQMDNPEVTVSQDSSAFTTASEQKFKLQSVTSVLKSAYRGQDIEWWDEEEEGEGSAAQPAYDYTDDEDGFGSGDYDVFGQEGSGEREEEEEEGEEEVVVPQWPVGDADGGVGFGGEEEWNPWPKFPAARPSTPPPATAGGASSVHLKSRWAVARAVLTYTLPMATCYFGAFLTDMPVIL